MEKIIVSYWATRGLAAMTTTADDILTIAAAVDDLSRMLDRLFDHCDDNARRHFEETWPGHAEIHSGVVRALKTLADQFTPSPQLKDS